MRKAFEKFVTLIIVLGLVSIVLGSCVNRNLLSVPGDTEPDETEPNSEITSDISIQEYEHYSLEFVSNRDGTCFVSKIINKYEEKEQYELVIPEVSPLGDKVAEVNTSLNANIVPRVILKEDFEQILYKIAETLAPGYGVAPEEIMENPYAYYKYSKVFAFYSEKDLTDESVTDQERQHIIENYPVAEYVSEFYVCTAETLKEFKDVDKYIANGYNSEEFIEDYRNLCEKIDNAGADADEKRRVLSDIPEVYYGFGKNITAIKLPSTVVKINPTLYGACENIKEIEISKAWSNISEITSDMFYGCTSLQKLTLNDNIKSIDEAAFVRCAKLESIIVPQSVTSIGYRAFSYCYDENGARIDSTVNVYYMGTEEEWKSIEIGGGNDRLSEAIIHYNYEIK